MVRTLLLTRTIRRQFSSIPLSHPIYTVWAANTGLGKTLVSAALASSILLSSPKPAEFHYIKPVQTGFPSDSDCRFVYNKVSEIFRRRHSAGTSLIASNLVLNTSVEAARGVQRRYEERRVGNESNGRRWMVCKTLFAWKEAVSPHLCVEREGGAVEDVELLESVQRSMSIGVSDEKVGEFWTLIETAGGVASPGPSGTLQCDIYRPFRLPAILIGDGRLGGISGTISAYETLKLRGYDVVAVVLEEHGLANDDSLSTYFQNRGALSFLMHRKKKSTNFTDQMKLFNTIPVLVLPPIPEDQSDDLMIWFDESCHVFDSLKQILQSAFSERVQRLHDLRKKAGELLWWPFTQHQLVHQESVTVIDSRCGEKFAVHQVQTHDCITQLFDACASWWTQGPDATLQIELAREMGYAAARYGHVMFPENVHEPALRCAELLLDGVGKCWASRTFFSDNGSTAIEVALKMAFRKFLCDHKSILKISDQKPLEFRVLALHGSYHGDTLGAMEAQAPSSYTGFLQQPWYTGRGLFVDPPTVYMHRGKWNLLLPKELHSDQLADLSFALRDELFCESRDASEISGRYLSYISKQLSAYSDGIQNKWIAALIIEPVIHGAGGMHMVDPLFQRVLVNECQKRKIPVIFDEVFTGFWRLGVESAAELLHCSPDIACFAKLMTGGIIPLAATLTTEAVFQSFMGDSKLKALLHGHSYTAHAMGCTAAIKSVVSFKDPKKNPNTTPEGRVLRELWDDSLVSKISFHPQIKRVVVLGTLFVLEIRAKDSNAGYASVYARSLLQELRDDGIYTRPLGNVIYLMCGPCTPPRVCRQLLEKLYQRIEEFHKKNPVL